MHPYLALLRVGFALPSAVTRDAVRSYRTFSPLPPVPEGTGGGSFSVALSVGSRLPGVTWHPALRSPDFPPSLAGQRLFDRLHGYYDHNHREMLATAAGIDMNRLENSYHRPMSTMKSRTTATFASTRSGDLEQKVSPGNRR